MEAALTTALERAAKERRARGEMLDHERITAMPRWLVKPGSEESQALVEKWTRALARNPARALDHRPLNPNQAYACELAYRASQESDPIGGYVNAGVGAGKTGMFFAVGTIFDKPRTCLLIPSEARARTADALYEWRRFYDFRQPKLVAYSELSSPKSSALLRNMFGKDMGPELFLADESQALKDFTAARTRRFLRYATNHWDEDVRYFMATGTSANRSLKEVAHLIYLCTRQYSPFPIDEDALDRWASVIDIGGDPDDWALSNLKPLVEWALGPDKETHAGTARLACQIRAATSPYVMYTTASSCDQPLDVKGKRFEVTPPLNNAIRTLANDFMLPDGTEVVDTFGLYRGLEDLSMGFYRVWDWPNGEPDHEWLEARSEWASCIRQYLKAHARENVDSPLLVENYVRRWPNKVPFMHEALMRWLDVKGRYRPSPPTKTVWMDYTPVIKAVEWANEQRAAGRPALLWWSGLPVRGALEQFGVPTMGAQSGTPDVHKTPVVGLSIACYHKGWNLQDWNHQLVMQPPSGGLTWEQLLGRCHRYGQDAPVSAEVYQHVWPVRRQTSRALDGARFLEDLFGQRQKLNLARLDDFGRWRRSS